MDEIYDPWPQVDGRIDAQRMVASLRSDQRYRVVHRRLSGALFRDIAEAEGCTASNASATWHKAIAEMARRWGYSAYGIDARRAEAKRRAEQQAAQAERMRADREAHEQYKRDRLALLAALRQERQQQRAALEASAAARRAEQQAAAAAVLAEVEADSAEPPPPRTPWPADNVDWEARAEDRRNRLRAQVARRKLEVFRRRCAEDLQRSGNPMHRWALAR